MNNATTSPQVIVSLTSFPAAIPYAVEAIRSVLNGSVLPDKVVLYLDTQKFPDGILPTELEDLKAECPIFEVRFDEDPTAFLTGMPFDSAYPISMLFTPVAASQISLSDGAASISSGVTRILFIISTSQSATLSMASSGVEFS